METEQKGPNSYGKDHNKKVSWPRIPQTLQALSVRHIGRVGFKKMPQEEWQSTSSSHP